MRTLNIILIIGGLVDFAFVIGNILLSHIWWGTALSLFGGLFSFGVAYLVKET